MAKINSLMGSKIIKDKYSYFDSNSQSYLLFVCLLFQIFFIVSCQGQYTQPTHFNEKGINIVTMHLEHITSFDDNKDVYLYNFKTGFGTFITKNIVLNGILDLMTFRGKYLLEDNSEIQVLPANTSAIGISALLRWHLIHIKTVSLYIDANTGFLYSFKSFPVNGTKLNFTVRPGIGIAIGLGKTSQLLVGANRFHLSNGQGYNHPINPGYDGLGLFIGIVLRFKRYMLNSNEKLD